MAEKKKESKKKKKSEAEPEHKTEAAPRPPVEVKKPIVVKTGLKPKKTKLPAGTKYYGTGRRKEAVAKVWLISGSGKIVLNGRDFSDYFAGRKVLEIKVRKPLVVTDNQQSFDVYANVLGGGVPGQAGAVSMGIARALLQVNPDLRIKLKREGLLRRDPRMKERKKYGLKRARKAFQYTKR